MLHDLGAAAALMFAAFAVHAADHYTLDAAHCIPAFEFSHLGMTTQTGRFDKAQGHVTLDLKARSGDVYFEVEAASLNMGFGTETPDSPGYRLFEVKKFPTITFRSDHLVFDDGGKVIAADGHLTMLGVTRPLRVSVAGFKCSANPMNRKPTCAGNITATVRRSEFGMIKYLPAIGDDVKIRVPIEAIKD